MSSQPRLFTNTIVPILQQSPVVSYPGVGSVIQASSRTRPFWFDGRFLAARDMQRDQHCFLARQAALGRAVGFGVIHGLQVETVSTGGDTIVIRAGQGLTPGGQLVMISTDLTIRISDHANEENLDEQFGLAETPTPVARTRTGLYVIALRPVEFSANPITSYPTSLQGSSTTHDGDIVEASGVALVPYSDPPANHDSTSRNAAAARQIFIAGDPGVVSDALLPLAMISIQRGVIEWVDPCLVRRDSGPEFNGLRFGLADPATQQAFLLQYDAQLQQAVTSFASKTMPPRFAASDYFQALPPAGRLPLASIDASALTQLYFPQQSDVWLSLIPQDELPAWIEDSLALAPIDLTQPASAFADLSVFILVPVPRAAYAGLAATLPPVQLQAAVPQAVNYRNAVSALRFFSGAPAGNSPGGSGWSGAIGRTIYGYYVRRRSSPIFVAPVNTNTTTTVTAIGSDVAGITLTATVSPSAVTGNVTFMDGTTVLGASALDGGVATLVLSVLAAGTHAIVASYPGDSKFTGSGSSPLNLTITSVPSTPKIGTTMALNQAPIPGAAVLVFRAIIVPSAATGNVLFQIDSGMAVSEVLSNGVATFQVGLQSVPAGAHTLIAEYPGDENYAQVSAQLRFTVG